jgi:hypothetical protein
VILNDFRAAGMGLGYGYRQYRYGTYNRYRRK